MKIAVIGTGYVGLVSAVCLAKMGNNVFCVDIDKEKIDKLNKGIIPIYEPGLEELVVDYKENLVFTTDLSMALSGAKVAFIAVGTPMAENGMANLNYIFDAAKNIGKTALNDLIVVDKSTVPVGTAKKVQEIINQELENRKADIKIEVVSNPEFLKEGAAIEDFLKPDRIILGTSSTHALDVMREVYEPFMKSKEKIISMDIESAEMTKYAANCMLATKISFINEIAGICEKVGADINMVRKGIAADARIGGAFIYPGCGFGGSCFPKDIEALIYIAKASGFEPLLLNAVNERNSLQKNVLFEKINSHFSGDLSGKTFAIWGLAFKPNTDDMREAPAIRLINSLLSAGATVRAFDPKAMSEAKKIFGDRISYASNQYEVLGNADALVLVTEWSIFRSPDFEKIKNLLKNPLIFDGRNQYDRLRLAKDGFIYHQIGVK